MRGRESRSDLVVSSFAAPSRQFQNQMGRVTELTKEPEAPASRMLVHHALMVGMTALIPVPLVDDLARNAMRRRFVRAVLGAEGIAAGWAVVEALANEPSRSWPMGCPLALVVYPIKKVFRKVFFFLEIKRGVDLASTTWHLGWLLQGLLREGHRVPDDPVATATLRATLISTADEVGVRPVERLFRGVFRGSTAGLRASAEQLGRAIGGGRTPQNVEAAVASVEMEEGAVMARLVDALLLAIDAQPREHFERLRAALRRRLTSL